MTAEPRKENIRRIGSLPQRNGVRVIEILNKEKCTNKELLFQYDSSQNIEERRRYYTRMKSKTF